MCDLESAHAVLSECRVVKSVAELEVLRYVNRVSSAGHVEVKPQKKTSVVGVMRRRSEWYLCRIVCHPTLRIE